MNAVIWLTLSAVAVSCVNGQGICFSPPPVNPFDYTKYTGLWYEIGKVQTPGGAEYQKDCVCTVADMKPNGLPNAAPSDGTVIYACREKVPQGPWLNITAILTDMDPNQPGVWLETFFPFTPIANEVYYSVIDMDVLAEEFAVEYDCNESDYCIHFFARRPTIDGDILRELLEKAVQMGLNPLNLPFEATNHKSCWDV